MYYIHFNIHFALFSTLYCIVLYYIILCYTMLYYIILYYILFYFIIFYIILYILYYIYYIILCYVLLCYTIHYTILNITLHCNIYNIYKISQSPAHLNVGVVLLGPYLHSGPQFCCSDLHVFHRHTHTPTHPPTRARPHTILELLRIKYCTPQTDKHISLIRRLWLMRDNTIQ